MPERSAATGADAARAAGLVVVASLLFAAMNVLAKAATLRGVPSLEVACARATVGAVGLGLLARLRGLDLRVGDRRTLAVRVVAGTGAMICTFHSLSSLPLGEATALLNTAPLFIAALGWLVLGERPSALTGAALVAGFVGVVLIVGPATPGGATWDATVAVLASLLSAVAMVSLRRMGGRERPEAIVVHFSAVAAVATGLLGARDFVVPDALGGAFMLGAGLTATVAQVAMTRAYALETAARIGGGGYLIVAVSPVAGMLLFGETPGWVSLVGITVILGAGVLLAVDAGYRPAALAVDAGYRPAALAAAAGQADGSASASPSPTARSADVVQSGAEARAAGGRVSVDGPDEATLSASARTESAIASSTR
jgi:drug/metabolite transporter (DMT)-like permease